MAANSIWQRSTAASNAPNLTYPYFPDADELWKKKEELEQRRAARGPEHEAKLKAARLKHIEMMKKERGNHNR